MNWFFVENLDCFDFAEGDSFLTSTDGYFFPIGLDMKSDGSALYYMANSGITKQAVTHSLTAWDLSTEAFVRATDFSSDVSGGVRGCAWGDSGDFFYISTTNGSTSYIYRFACSTPYDTSTKGTKTSTSINTSGFSLGDIFWKPDGTKLFVVYRDNISGGSLNKLASINLNTAWDITDISSTTTANLNTSNPIRPIGLWLNSDGSRVLIGAQENIITEFIMTTPYDVSTLEEHLFYNQFTTSYGVFSKNDNYDNIIAVSSPTHKIQEEIKTCEAIFPPNGFSDANSAYGTRNMTDTYSGNVIRVRRASDNTEQDFTAAEIVDGTLATFSSGGNAFVVTWYDQIGSLDLTLATSTIQAYIVASGTVSVDGNGVPFAYGTSNNTATAFSIYTSSSSIAGDWISALYAGKQKTGSSIRLCAASTSSRWDWLNITTGGEYGVSGDGFSTTFGISINSGDLMVAMFQVEDGVANNKMWLTETTQGNVSASITAEACDTSTGSNFSFTVGEGGSTSKIFYGGVIYNTQQEVNQVTLMQSLNDIYELGFTVT